MEVRALLRELFDEAVAAVEPAAAVRRAVSAFPGRLRCDGVDHIVTGAVVVLALGKAAGAMAAGLLPLAEEAGLPCTGLVVTDHATASGLPVMVAGHPHPTAASAAAAKRLLGLAASASPDDLVVVLLSGGGSALATLPAPGLAPGDVALTARLLMDAGADIAELNCVRKHVSGFAGGRLAAACRKSRLLTLVISDVVGDALDVIASGPTVPDPTSYADALEVLRGRGVSEQVPAAVVSVLEEGAAGRRSETVKEPHPAQQIGIVASGATAAAAAAAAARRRGLGGRVVTTTLSGEARHAAVELVRRAEPGTVLVAAGETTVTVTGSGSGGRNQEAALAAALALAGSEVGFLAAGTDGVDGPTTAAGGAVDGTTAARIAAAGVDPAAALSDNDSHPALRAGGALVVTGPTGTNVGDLWLVHLPVNRT